MSLFSKIQNLKTQIIETERLLDLVADHPIMSIGLKEKIQLLEKELSELPKETFEAKVELLFSGTAVSGSEGIKLNFLNKIFIPFQNIVKTQVAINVHSNRVKRNALKNKSTLYLTALPVGSFGIELSQLTKEDLLDDIEVSESIKQVIHLIARTCENDEEFENVIENNPKSILSNLNKFFKAISDEESILKIESNEVFLEIPKEVIHLAHERVSKTIEEEFDEVVEGVFKGILLESGKFEIITNEGRLISGFISEDLDEETIVRYQKDYINTKKKFLVSKTEIHFKTGNIKTNFELKEII